MLRQCVKEKLKNIYWGFYGRGIKNPPLAKSPKTFLFICKGNICRSPFAQGYAIKTANASGCQGSTFFSAGLEVSMALPPPREAFLAAEAFCVDLQGHRSCSVTEEMIASSDMIITMEARHFLFLRESFPRMKDRIFLLSLFTRSDHEKIASGYSSYNISDPYGKPLEQFQACFAAIAQSVDILFSKITDKQEMAHSR